MTDLKAPCQHGRYDEHGYNERLCDHKKLCIDPFHWINHLCSGGTILPPGSLIIVKEDGEWPEGSVDLILEWFYDHDGTPLVPESRLTYIEHLLDALAAAQRNTE